MAQINPPKPVVPARRHALREDDLDTITVDGEAFWERHRTAILAAIAAVVVLVAAVLGWSAYQDNRSEQAQQLLGAVLTEYQAGNYQAALDGVDGQPGLLAIADDYGSTPTGEQATFLAADALFQLGQTDEADAMFAEYDGEGLFEASALAGRAAIAEAKGDDAAAAALYEQAATAYATPAAAPGYLLAAARAHTAAGEADEAQAALQTLLDDYAETPEAQTAQLEIGMATATATATGTATGRIQPAPAQDSTSAAGVAPTTLTLPAQ